MANQSNKTQSVSVRIPNEEVAVLDTFASGKGISRSSALLYFLKAGIKAEASYQAPASSAEITALRAELQSSFGAVVKAIENQPIQVQAPLPTPALESTEQKTTRWARLKQAWRKDEK